MRRWERVIAPTLEFFLRSSFLSFRSAQLSYLRSNKSVNECRFLAASSSLASKFYCHDSVNICALIQAISADRKLRHMRFFPYDFANGRNQGNCLAMKGNWEFINGWVMTDNRNWWHCLVGRLKSARLLDRPTSRRTKPVRLDGTKRGRFSRRRVSAKISPSRAYSSPAVSPKKFQHGFRARVCNAGQRRARTRALRTQAIRSNSGPSAASGYTH